MAEKIRLFLQESREEWRHVNWPTRNEAIRLTSVVIIFSVFLAVFLGFADFAFLEFLRAFIGF